MLRKEEDILMHYGVLGMRWGHRKDGGPQGYLGTYPKDRYITKGIVTGDNSSTNYYQTSGDSLDESVYSMYAEHGISRDMVDVNGGGGDRNEYRNQNCAMCTTAAIMNKMGIKCTAGETAIGVTPKEIASMFNSSDSLDADGGFKDRILDTPYDDAIHELESRSKPGDYGYFHEHNTMGGHSMYYTIDENGKAFIADFQNPNRKGGTINQDNYNNFTFFNVRGKVPDTSLMEEVGIIRTDDYKDDYEDRYPYRPEKTIDDLNALWRKTDRQRMSDRESSNMRIFGDDMYESTQHGRALIYDMFDQLRIDHEVYD